MKSGSVAYSRRGRGALLSLPHGGRREDAVQMKVFEKYIRDNVVSWFIWAQKNQLGVERMEDLILVSGCTLVTTWAAAVFMDHTTSTEISLASRTLSNGGASFAWSNVRGPRDESCCTFVQPRKYCRISVVDRRSADLSQTDDNGTALDKAGKTMTGIFGTTFEYHNFVTSAMLRVRFLS